MYYIANPRTRLIEHITFYDENGDIKHSLDLEFNRDGSSMPYREFFRRGKLRSEGTHFHQRWPKDENGNKGRAPHTPDNTSEVNSYYMRFVNLAIEYNQNIRRQ